MAQKWRFKIDLKENQAWSCFESITSFSAPEDLKHFVEKYNAASPDENCIDINECQRVIDAVLSFNETEVDSATFKGSYKVIPNKKMIPFAIDPFGNYFCYCMNTHRVYFYTHEENQFEDTNYTLDEFVQKLYNDEN